MNEIYIEILETFRKQQGMSVEALIDGITSSRSYHRYVSQETDIPIGILLKLIQKMNISSVSFFVHCINLYKEGMFDMGIFMSAMIDDKYDLAKTLVPSIEHIVKPALESLEDASFQEKYHKTLSEKELDGDISGNINAYYLLTEYIRLQVAEENMSLEAYERAINLLYDKNLLRFSNYNSGIILATLYFSINYPDPSLDIKAFMKAIDNKHFFSEGTVGIFMPSMLILDTLTQEDLKKHLNAYEGHINHIKHLAEYAAMPVVKKHVYKHLANIAYLKDDKVSFDTYLKKYKAVLMLIESKEQYKASLEIIQSKYQTPLKS